jgi:hypothetical protein
MSALPPKADMCGATRDVRFGPIEDKRGCHAPDIGETNKGCHPSALTNMVKLVFHGQKDDKIGAALDPQESTAPISYPSPSPEVGATFLLYD